MNKDSNSSAGDAPTEQQGIFSTPELTVDAEKVTADTAAAAESSRAKIASIFASTETSKQAQQLNDAMAANSTPAYATEDIKLDSGVKKKKKWPIVVAIVALLVISGGAIGAILLSNNSSSDDITTAEKLAAYLKLVQEGPENVPVIDEEAGTIDSQNAWFLLKVADSGLQRSELKKYLEDVQSAYDLFDDSFVKNSNTQVDDAKGYQDLLTVYLQLSGLSILSDTLASKYVNEGPNSAYNYVQTFAYDEDNLSSLKQNGVAQIKKYLDEELEMLSIADAENCIIDGRIDDICRMDLSETSGAYYETLQNQQNTLKNIINIAKVLGNDLEVQTKLLEEEVRNEG